ncbi:hypothetical protein [Okeania sp.]|nr:hypothetical protein [Okeania sp.]MEB3340655.1 hypothetical protein [Okeania sp.]
MTIFQVKVKPSSKQQSMETEADGSLKICLKSPLSVISYQHL